MRHELKNTLAGRISILDSTACSFMQGGTSVAHIGIVVGTVGKSRVLQALDDGVREEGFGKNVAG